MELCLDKIGQTRRAWYSYVMKNDRIKNEWFAVLWLHLNVELGHRDGEIFFSFCLTILKQNVIDNHSRRRRLSEKCRKTVTWPGHGAQILVQRKNNTLGDWFQRCYYTLFSFFLSLALSLCNACSTLELYTCIYAI